MDTDETQGRKTATNMVRFAGLLSSVLIRENQWFN